MDYWWCQYGFLYILLPLGSYTFLQRNTLSLATWQVGRRAARGDPSLSGTMFQAGVTPLSTSLENLMYLDREERLSISQVFILDIYLQYSLNVITKHLSSMQATEVKSLCLLAKTSSLQSSCCRPMSVCSGR